MPRIIKLPIKFTTKNMSTTKICQQCQSPLKGRSDKKFCDDYCRSQYYSQQHKINNDCIKFVTNRLRKNRMILKKLYTQKKYSISLHHIPIFGMDLCFHTHKFKSSNGDIYTMVFDYGFKLCPDQGIQIIQSDVNFDNLILNDSIENMYSALFKER